MKLIDEKGKLLGKVSIIDLFVLFFVVVVLSLAVYKFGKPDGGGGWAEPPLSRDVTITAKFTVDDEAYVKKLKVGDQLIIGKGLTDAKIDSIKISPALNQFYNEQGIRVYSYDEFKKDVMVTIKYIYTKNTPTVMFNERDVCINNQFNLKTESTAMQGLITDVIIVNSQAPK